MRYLLLSLLLATGLSAGELPKEKRVLFLGDSITQGGGYIEIIDAALKEQHREANSRVLTFTSVSIGLWRK